MGNNTPLPPNPTPSRKRDHIRVCLGEDVEYACSAGFETLELVHRSLPELGLDDIDLRCELFGQSLSAPLVLEAISGGTEQAGRLNRDLGWAARKRGLALGLGSQRPMLEDPALTATFQVEHPDEVLVMGNLGLVQARDLSARDLDGLADAVGAKAFCLHLNPVMEIVQPEGDRSFQGCAEALSRLTGEMRTPVVVKETGAGLSRETGLDLREAGVRHVDAAGAGGTSWPKVERIRAGRDPGPFDEWGIPTVESLRAVLPLGFDTVIASGGLRSGVDIAKALALGAHAGGMALPVLRAWDRDGLDGVLALVDRILEELKAAMLLAGASTVSALRDGTRLSP